MSKITSKPDWGTTLIEDGKPTVNFQFFMDELEERLNANLLGDQVTLTSYTVASLPPVTALPGLIFVSDEAGGAVPAFSDGFSWRRCTDRAVVS